MSSMSTEAVGAGLARARVPLRFVSLITGVTLTALTRRVNQDLTPDAFWVVDAPQSIYWHEVAYS